MNQESRDTLGQFLRFMGLMITLGGALAILRLHEHRIDYLYNAMIPIGLIVWYAGHRLRRSP